MGFFKRLVTRDDEEAFVDGCRELVLGHDARAYAHLQKAAHLGDGAFLAGCMALKKNRLGEAARFLSTAADGRARLGRYFEKYGLAASMSLPITDEVQVHVSPDRRGALLGLVEVYQRQEKWKEAIACLRQIERLDPQDVVIKLSLAELMLEARPGDRRVCRQIVEVCKGVRNHTPVHAALLLYKAKALRGLGLAEAARDTLTSALRRKKERPEELLRALRYERALAYEDLGEDRRARSDLEKLYAEAPDYEDVGPRLGLEAG
jgi:tetratricopeptide (TPR) repeat protein